MRWLLLLLAFSGTTFAQSIVLTEAFSDGAGSVHFAVTKVVRLEGDWKKNPLEVGTIIDPPRVKKAYPLRRFGENVVFVLPKADNLRAYWSYNVHDGFVPGMGGRTMDELVGMLVASAEAQQVREPATPVPPAPSRTQVARYRDEPSAKEEPNMPSHLATHQLMVEAFQALSASAAGEAKTESSLRTRRAARVEAP